MTILAPMPVTTEIQHNIPKVIHHIWVGGDPPDWVQRSWAGWRWFLDGTDWDLRIWTDEEVVANPIFKRTLYEGRKRGVHPRGISNMLRVQIVALFGGLYVDVDCIPLGNLDELAGAQRSWVACAPKSRRQLQMENSAFGFSQGHLFLLDVLDVAEDSLNRGVMADFFLGGSRSFRWVWDRGRYDMDVRWDYTAAGNVDLRRALADLPSADLPNLLERYGPFPIAHVWKPRL